VCHTGQTEPPQHGSWSTLLFCPARTAQRIGSVLQPRWNRTLFTATAQVTFISTESQGSIQPLLHALCSHHKKATNMRRHAASQS